MQRASAAAAGRGLQLGCPSCWHACDPARCCPCPNAPPQVEQWQRDEIMGFWARHYFPANATLYVVGDIDVQASGS